MDNSFTPYDDAWRTLISEARVTLIPLINEMFKDSGIHYKGDEKIELLNDDIFLPRKDGEQSKRIVDSAFTVDDGEIVRKFHIECQSTTDGTMMVRMFEYDAQIALNDARCRKTSGDLYIRFPASGILYLRSTANTPDHPTITIEVPLGEKVTYSIPALKISDYSAEDIRNKDLFLMIPFYVFKFEKYFTQMEKQGGWCYKATDIRIKQLMRDIERCSVYRKDNRTGCYGHIGHVQESMGPSGIQSQKCTKGDQ